MVSQIKVDSILESTSASGVTVDGALIKDGKIAGSAGGGLVYLTGATVSTLSGSIEIDSVFSSTYANYKILVYGNTASANSCQVQFQMRASGSNTTSSYRGLRAYSNTGGSGTNGADTGTSYWYMGDISSDQAKKAAHDITLFKPNLAEPTIFISNGAGTWSSSDFYYQQCYGVHDSNTQFDGFRFLPVNGSHTMSLTYKIYGMVNS